MTMSANTWTNSSTLWVIAVIVFILQPATSHNSGIALNEFIRHFEPLFYDDQHVRQQHARWKRESRSDESHKIHFQFHAHNKLFKIRLRRSSGLFADDVIFESSRGAVDYDLDRVYHGQLEDDERSSVNAVLTSSGQLDAEVSTESETYYVEPSTRYFPSNVSFPAVIYKASDVQHPDDDQDTPCPSHQLYLKQFEHFHHQLTNRRNQTVIPSCQSKHDVQGIEANQLIDRTLYSGWNRSDRKKKRRSTIDYRKTTCMLYLQADHLFYHKMGSEEACIETMTRHVQRVNSIYKNVDFDGDGQGDDINFMIKRIKVHTEQALNEASYRFPGNYGVEKFLELFSEEDYNAFCLAYMFTYRDFEGGTLGLAWTGDLKNAGGVCEKNGHYRGSLKSLNTGIVTLLNYGKHVPPAVSHVTLAHEIGHNFGSPHDPENNRECTPGGEDGNYIMFARATSGDKRNNNKFSPCSLKSINGVLSTKARNEQGCFTEPQNAICGNGVVEAGEECDCGWEEDCQEKCCFPMRSVQQPGERPCTLRPSTTCSPSQGPCCTETCQTRYGFKCREDNGCRDASYCDGSGPKCPPSNNKPNKTVCNDEFVCFMGECTGSICIAYGLQSCQCLQGPTDPPTKACELCCKLPGDDQPCLSSFEWNTPPYDVPSAHAKAGTPCNNYNGYCDVFQRCREVDPSGPLATLRRLLLSDESIASLKKWIEDHWYGVLFIAVGFITVIAVVARVFGKRVHRKMRRRTTNGATTTATAPTASAAVPDESGGAQHIVHPVAVRSKIPLKRKVREKGKKRTGGRIHGHHHYPAASSALAVFRLKNKDKSGSRKRRSGVVNTKDKVQSWLERENPTTEKIDSDNDSHFPDEEVTDSGARKHHSAGSLVEIDPASAADQNKTTKPVKMMRSVSESTPARCLPPPHRNSTADAGSHRFGRSISHGGHDGPSGEFVGRLGRKTESHSHLLSSKSELDLIDKPVAEEHPAVNNHPPVEKQIPVKRSATEGQLKATTPSSNNNKNKKTIFASFEFLNLMINRTKNPPDHQQQQRPAAKTSLTNGRNTADSKIRKKIGLGPVKVVLKWHGNASAAGRTTRVKRNHPAAAVVAPGGDKPRTNNKKRVIVYQNGDPTINNKTQSIPAEVQHPPAGPAIRPEMKITANPMALPRRYSVQESVKKSNPALIRRVSEIHPPAGIDDTLNKRRNRHSWTPSAGSYPVIAGCADISIQMADQQVDEELEEDC